MQILALTQISCGNYSPGHRIPLCNMKLWENLSAQEVMFYEPNILGQ